MAKDTNNKVGRPTKMTPWVVRKLEDAFKFGATVSEACYLSGISRESFYNYYRQNQEFSDKIESARSWLAVKAKHNLATAILDGDIKSSLWLLDKRDSLPTSSVQLEEKPVKQEEAWDEGDVEMLNALVKTQEQLRKQHAGAANSDKNLQ